MRNARMILVLLGLVGLASRASAEEALASDASSSGPTCAVPTNPYEETEETRNPYLLSSDLLDGMVEPNPYRTASEPTPRAEAASSDGCALALVGAVNPYLEEVAIEENPYLIASFTGIDQATEPNPYY